MQRDVLVFLAFYAILAYLYLRLSFPVSWDPAEYLAYGKYIFGGYGFDAYYRPIIWPLLLGFLWKAGVPMPLGMKALAALIYLSIPLVPFFLQKGCRRYIGLAIASHPIFFKWSHLPLSHIIATFFLVLAYSTSGFISGIFAALSGLSRFPFLLFSLFHVIGDKKKFLGASSVFLIYFSAIALAYGDPLAQIKKASEIIGWSKYYDLWPRDPLFYIKILISTSPLLFLGFFTLSKFSLSALISLLFFTFKIYRKEDRFFIDILPYLVLSLDRRKRLLLLTIAFSFLQLPSITIFSENTEFFRIVENNARVIGMHPGINAYRDVYFVPWFDYFQFFNFTRADYCIFFRDAIPCPNSFCISKVEEFYRKCSSWIVLYNESDRIIIAKKPTPRLYAEQE